MKIIYDTATNTLLKYPRSDDNPVVGLSQGLIVLNVIEEPQPELGDNQTLVKSEPDIDLQNETVTYGWIVIQNETPPQEPQWVEFGTALGMDLSVNQFIGSLVIQAPVLHLMIGVGMGQAAQGDSRTFLAAWNSARAANLITIEFADHVRTMAESFNLPLEFTEQLIS